MTWHPITHCYPCSDGLKLLCCVHNAHTVRMHYWNAQYAKITHTTLFGFFCTNDKRDIDFSPWWKLVQHVQLNLNWISMHLRLTSYYKLTLIWSMCVCSVAELPVTSGSWDIFRSCPSSHLSESLLDCWYLVADFIRLFSCLLLKCGKEMNS